MNRKNYLNDVWIKASILGTLWASTEIVFGSFLHNLKIPFSGNLLTAIGLIILISIGQKWKNKGLFWRAGIITAFLKTLSPSAVIFGPMIAIIAESVLLEFSVKIFGRTYLGFLLGASLAMSWNLFQKLFNYVIYYGNNIIEIYKSLVEYASKQLGIGFQSLWWPIIILLGLYILFGLFTGLIGMSIGRKINKLKNDDEYESKNNEKFQIKNKNEDFNYSKTWLVVNFILTAASIAILNAFTWYYWIGFTLIVSIVWSFRYKRAARQLLKPKLWISFVLITSITTFIFNDSRDVINGLMIGLNMNFRAIIMVMGFAVIGTELYNPKIRQSFKNSRFRNFDLAMELSVGLLPDVISKLPDLNTFLKNPLILFRNIFILSDTKLKEYSISDKPCVFIFTGEIGEGKTECVINVVKTFNDKSVPIKGIYSKRVMDDNDTIGYDIVNVCKDEVFEFLRKVKSDNNCKIGPYFINQTSLKLGRGIIEEKTDAKIVFIDEVGKLELSDDGWAESIDYLLKTQNCSLVLAVRKKFVNPVIEKWSFNKVKVFDVKINNHTEIANSILSEMNILNKN